MKSFSCASDLRDHDARQGNEAHGRRNVAAAGKATGQGCIRVCCRATAKAKSGPSLFRLQSEASCPSCRHDGISQDEGLTRVAATYVLVALHLCGMLKMQRGYALTFQVIR